MDAKFKGTIIKAKDGSVVPEDEYIVFLVKDNAFAAVLPQYLAKCIELACDPEQIDSVIAMIQRVVNWRNANPDRCKRPDAAGERLLA